MIIYDYRKPVEFENGNCVGVTGENLAYTQEFLIKGMRDTAVNYTIHLRFPDGSVNSVIPDRTVITGDGTRLVWNVKKTDIFVHGYFELQLCGQSNDGMIFQTEIVTLYADESLAVEDKEYANPNAETLQIRDEANRLLSETVKQQKQIEENYKLITQTDLSLKEDSVNKVSSKKDISYTESSYPSIEYLHNYYYTFDETYSVEEVDAALDSKADKATTLDGYGITDAYTKEQMSKYLNNKQDKLGWDTVPAQNSPNAMTSGSIYTALQPKANTTDVDSKLALKYDASNVETGLGTLECADETLADKLAATFKYQKIGKFCLLDIQIKATEKIDGDVIFDGLPFVAKSASYSVCSSNYGNVRSLVIPYNNSKLKLIGGITTTTTVAITVIYRIEN